ncbi:hypothetical protein [Nocardia wallacei]|uniref:hypothetical protein n=1 Tax=Nocardia wallacei TaxID=480035 RepID=UPI0024588861|nr:hypothetical protein [Nocardia wallacei]
MSAHHILIKSDDGTITVECPPPGTCGFIRCDEPHKADGFDADDGGPYDCSPDAPYEGMEEFEFHGIEHTWIDHLDGWSVPYTGCVVRDHFGMPTEAEDLLGGMPPGRYPVRDHWDEDEMRLELAPEATS